MIAETEFSDHRLCRAAFAFLEKEFVLYRRTKAYIFEHFTKSYLVGLEALLGFLAERPENDGALVKPLRAFIKYSYEFITKQRALERGNRYEYASFEEVRKAVYDNEVMNSYYLDGLALSQYLWPNHYRMNQFLVAAGVRAGCPSPVLDVPCGTGLQSVLYGQGCRPQRIDLRDLSSFSVAYAQKLLDRFGLSDRATFERMPIESCRGQYPFVINGELLEHLEDPGLMLSRLARMLTPQGRLYLTTAVFAAAVDHIYLFHTVAEVRELVSRYFVIEQELALPVSLEPYREDMANVPINYACVLKHP